MARRYRYIQQYEKELLELKEQGLTVREIGEKYGLSYEQAHDFFKRHNRKQRKSIWSYIAIRINTVLAICADSSLYHAADTIKICFNIFCIL